MRDLEGFEAGLDRLPSFCVIKLFLACVRLLQREQERKLKVDIGPRPRHTMTFQTILQEKVVI